MTATASLRVAYELTVLELDDAGTARAARGVRAALLERDDVDLLDVAHPRSLPLRGRLLRGLDRELRWFPWSLARRAQGAGAELIHMPAALGPPGGRVPYVVTINDVLALDHPGWFSRANALQTRLLLGRMARNARAVIVPSSHTRDRLLDRSGVAPEHVHVVPYGVGSPFVPGAADDRVLARLGVRAPYVLTVATFQPRKNLQGALAAHAGARRAHPDLQLVVVGGRGWRDEAVVARLRESRSAGVVLTGRIADDDLVSLLRGAELLLHPSRHEGFGFPPLEAMACGTPVVAALGGSVPEVLGGAGTLVDIDDAEASAAAITALLDDRRRRDQARAKGLARSAELTWPACAASTAGVYRKALGR